jgi:hypothetical protein
VNKYRVPVLGILAIWFAIQSSLFSSADIAANPSWCFASSAIRCFA